MKFINDMAKVQRKIGMSKKNIKKITAIYQNSYDQSALTALSKSLSKSRILRSR